MEITGIRGWGEAVLTSLTAALALFLAAIPRIVGFLVIVLVGWLIASAIGRITGAVLRRIDFDGLARRSGFSDFVDKTGMKTDAAGFIADVGKWFTRLIVLVVAFDALNLPAVSRVLSSLLMWLPNLVVALVALVLGGLAARALGGVVRGSTAKAGFERPELVATLAEAAVWGFAIVVAVNQLGIAATLVNTLFTGLVTAVALAGGIAFGLGGRETASEIVRDWYAKGREVAPKLAEAAEEARRRAEAEARAMGTAIHHGEAHAGGAAHPATPQHGTCGSPAGTEPYPGGRPRTRG